MKRLLAGLAAFALVIGIADGAEPARGDWPNYGRTPGGDRHSPLTQIDRANVGQLTLAWEYKTGEAGIKTGNPTALEATPLVIDGVMYLSTPLGKVIALDPVSGKQKWVRDVGVKRERHFGDWVSRGVSYWRDSRAKAPRPVLAAHLLRRRRRAHGRAGRGHRRVLQGLRQGWRRSISCRCCGTSNPTATNTNRPRRPRSSATSSSSAPPSPTTIPTWARPAKCAPSTRAPARCAGPGIRCRRIRVIPRYKTWAGAAAHRTGGANTWSIIAADPAARPGVPADHEPRGRLLRRHAPR